MAQYRLQVINSNPSQPARDAIVNTIYLDTDVTILTGTDEQALAQDLANIWVNRMPTLGQIKVQLYDMSDPKPRRPKATSTQNTTPSTGLAPREVALCLSFYADDNVPRRRGRIFLGPFRASEMSERPGQLLIDRAKSVAQDLANLGGANVQWVVHSPTTGDFHNVTHVWVDDEWDTIRSRGRRAGVRNLQELEG